MLKRSKKNNAQQDWIKALREEALLHDTERANRLVETALSRLPKNLDRCVYGWSGGKDALALQVVCQRAGIEKGVCGTIGADWEFPSFKKYIDENRPTGCTIWNHDIKADFFNKHPEMAFPTTSQAAYKWFRLCNQKAYYAYAEAVGAENIILGHRTADGNVCADRKGKVYPIYDFTHEDIFCILSCFGIKLPDIYFYPNGFYHGTHAWVMRDGPNAMDEVWEIDASLLLKHREIEKIDQYVKARYCEEGRW